MGTFLGDIGSDVSQAAADIESDVSELTTNAGAGLLGLLSAIPGAALVTGLTPLQTLAVPIGTAIDALGSSTGDESLQAFGNQILTGDITLQQVLVKDPAAAGELLAGGAAIATGQPEVAVPAFAAAAQRLTQDFMPTKPPVKAAPPTQAAPPVQSSSTVTRNQGTLVKAQQSVPGSSAIPAPKAGLIARFIAWFKAEF